MEDRFRYASLAASIADIIQESRELTGISRQELASYVAPYWNVQPLSALTYVRQNIELADPGAKVSNTYGLAMTNLVCAGVARPREADIFRQRLSDWLQAFDLPPEHRDVIAAALKGMNAEWTLPESPVPPYQSVRVDYDDLVTKIAVLHAQHPHKLIPVVRAVQQAITHTNDGHPERR